MILCETLRLGAFRGLGANLDTAIDFLLSGAWRDLPDGHHAIDGEEVFALISSYATRRSEDLRWESHRRYLDFQTLLSGRECVLARDIEGLEVEEAWDSERDIAFHGVPDASRGSAFQRLLLVPGLVAVFLPEDAHAPCAAIDAPEPVRKLVVKAASLPH